MRCAAALILIAVLALLAPSASSAQTAGSTTMTFTGRTVGDQVVFRAAALKGKKVRKLSMRYRGKKVKLKQKHSKKVTKKGVLTVKAPRVPLKAPKPAAGTPAPSTTGTATSAPAAPAAPATPQLVAVVEQPAAQQPAAQQAPVTAQSACDDAGQFGAGRWPSRCWRPYGDSSPFNRRLAPNAPVHPRSAQWVAKLTSAGEPQALPAGAADSKDDWGHPTFYATASDPVFTVHCAESWGRCPIEGEQIHVPDAARAAAGGDGHMTVVDQTSGWEYDFWQVRSKQRGGGTLTISWGGKTRIDGDGLGSDGTAAGFGNLAGIIRAEELAAGEIRHALFMTFPCDAQGAVYPAKKGGSHCPDQASAFPMGTRFALDMSDAEIDALRVPQYKKTILKAMAHYGMYFGDTGGNSWAVQLESATTYTAFGVADPTVSIARQAGVPAYDGIHWMKLAGDVDWRGRLKALQPCTAQGTC